MTTSAPSRSSPLSPSPAPLPLPPEVVLSARNVSKKFCRHLRRSMFYGMVDLAKGMAGVRPDCGQLRKGEFWAVNDVSFDLRRGEVLGIIGENGCGKSTLLRILNGIFPPDRGEVRVRGRVGGLIALGAGMHPHMTGMENIYINGTVLGMSRREIESKIPAIIEFADIGEFMSAPLTTYSSGMKVRLGFAVAAHCDLDVMLLDEVLAVGDLAFQQKCHTWFEESRRRGVSTVFVSHSMRQVERLCDRAILLHEGRLAMQGGTQAVVDEYFRRVMEVEFEGASRRLSGMRIEGVEGVRLERVFFVDAEGRETQVVQTGEPTTACIEIQFDRRIQRPIVALGLVTSDKLLVGAVGNEFDPSRADAEGRVTYRCRISRMPLLPGVYSVRIKVRDGVTALVLSAEQATVFKVVPSADMRYGLDVAGLIRLDASWTQKT